MAQGLITKDILRFSTDIGECGIELCVGDITQLPKEEKVDVLVVSAFPGDYSPTPSSLIGQLQIKLGLSVRKLSTDKEEDLRRQYYCWWSKPLTDELSFGRILCFEGGFRGSRPPAVIGAVFRCLVPVLNNQEGSVMMPLLTSGDQGYSEQLVLRQVMNAAIHWMKAGLPLRTLKVVIFARNPEKEDKSHKPLFELFKEYKDKYEDKNIDEEIQDPADSKDIYLSHASEDHNTAVEVRKYLESKGDISIFDQVQELNANESWQDEIYTAMARCARVVTLLSPEYLSSVSCIEQYNMAMCISRKKHKEVLAPLYITTIPTLPTYMGLIQYIDCRPRDTEKLEKAMYAIKEWLSSNKVKQEVSPLELSQLSGDKHDVFISYSHCNDAEAMKVLQLLKEHNPSINVFIDTSGLNTGASWQQALYHALDNSRSVVALLSPDYVKSKVCKEEYSLALALHMDPQRDFRLVSIVIEPVDQLPVWCCKPLAVDCSAEDADGTSHLSVVVRSLSAPEEEIADLQYRLSLLKSSDVTIDAITTKYRQIQFVRRQKLLPEPVPYYSQPSERSGHAHDVVFASDGHHQSAAIPDNEHAHERGCDVALSYSVEDSPAAATMKQLLIERHRCSKEQLLYIVHLSALPPTPTYVHLIPCEFAAADYYWKVQASPNQQCVGEGRRFAVDEGVASCLIDASDVIASRLAGEVSGYQGDYCQVLLNGLEVLHTWDELCGRMRELQGMQRLQRAFGLELTVEMPLEERRKVVEKDFKTKMATDAKTEKAPESPRELVDKEKPVIIRTRTVSFSPEVEVADDAYHSSHRSAACSLF
ncbi:uncharacterized protein LOC5508685 isoform X2 [Nematostella vectensis]|uniref:uncharacterized protein LOC5508685 isoform X2 n=1 Tax=Nematostella vectensis TaxID=45351 RepID=UPI00138FDEE5|nr:uncharacterized protein LOC5508685 isoform X2 [Nematostella vectensis]